MNHARLVKNHARIAVATVLLWGVLLGQSRGVAASDTPTVPALTPHGVTLREGTGGEVLARFRLELSRPSSTPLDVGYETIEGSARTGVDFEARRGTLIVPAGDTEAFVSIPLLTDALGEGVETFDLALTPSPQFSLTATRATATILDDDVPLVSIRDTSALEGSAFETAVRVPITLSLPSALPVSVAVSVVDGTARSTSDYSPTNAVVSFPPGSQRQEFVFYLRPDTIAEFNETIGVRLGNPTNAALGTASAEVLVLDDDPTPSVSVEAGEAVESTGDPSSLTFRVRLSGPATQPVRVSYSTRNGTATAGIDYVARLGTLVIPSGTVETTLAVAILGDAIAEPDETFALVLRNPVNATLGNPEAFGRIRDDDRPLKVSVADASSREGSDDSPQFLSFRVFLDAAPTNDVVVQYATEPGSAAAGSDYVAARGNLKFVPIGTGSTQHVVRVPIVGDTLPEPNEALRFRLFDAENAVIGRGEASGEIVNDDGALLSIEDRSVTEGDRSDVVAEFLVRRLGPSSETATARYATRGLTAREAVDFVARTGQVTFRPGETVAIIPVTVRADLLDEPDEDFEVLLSEAEGATLFRSSAVGTIVDDDLPEIRVRAIDVLEGSTGSAYARFVVGLDSEPSQEASVDFEIRPGTAKADEDYLPVRGTLTFAPGVRERQVAVAVLGDTIDEADETFSLVFSNPRFAEIGAAETIATLIDDDPMPFVSIEDAEARECSGGSDPAPLNLTVRLSVPSGRTVRIPFLTRGLTALPDADFLSLTNEIVFDPGATARVVSVPIRCDDDDERDEVFEVVLGAPDFAILSRARARGRILDDDPPTLRIGDLRVVEGNAGAAEALVQVSLSSAASETVAVDYFTIDGTARAGSDYLAVSNTLVVLPGTTQATLRVPIVPDTVPEDDETFALLLSNPRNIRLERDRSEITLEDDDPPLLLFDDARVVEGNTGVRAIALAFRLSRTNALPVSFAFGTRSGTATSGEDFIPSQGTVRFDPGVTEATTSLSVLGDTRIENDEAFVLELSVVANAVPARTNLTITILDDEAAPAISVADQVVTEGPPGGHAFSVPITLSTESVLPIRVLARTVAETARVDSDFRSAESWIEFPPGSRTRAFDVVVVGDDVTESSETFRVELSAPTNATIASASARVLVRDDDAPVVRGTNVTVIALRTETAIASVVFSLSQPSPEPIRVPYATVDDTAVAPDDYSPSRGVLVFLPGETQRGLEIPVAPNSAGEGIERFRVRLEAPTNAVLERVEIFVELLPEPEPNRPPQVRLLAPEDALEVTVGSAIDVVAEASDPEGSPVSVAFRAGDLTLGEQSAAPYRIRWVPSSTGTFELTAIATDDAGLSSGSTPVRVRVEPLPTLTAFPVSTAESSGAARVPVTLSRASRDVVTVHVATREATARAGSDFAARAETLTFQPGQTNLVVGIDVLDDDTPETAETFLIDFGSPTNTTIATRTIAVEITDDDLPPSTNHPPSVVLAAPADLDVVRPGDAVRVRAEAVDVDGPVVRVEFFVDDRLAATDTEAPFEWEWRPVQPGDYRIGARAVDREGASGEARPVRLAVTDSCGRVAIVTPGRDAETDRLREYLFELGQPSSVFERSTSRPEHFLGFDLVIWRDDGRAVLSAEDVRLAKALAATGVPAYYAGERVVDAHRSLDTESQADWLELIGMRPGVPEDVPDRVEISDDDLPGSVSPIVRGGKVGDVGGFAYPFAFSIGSRSEPNGEVVLATAGTTAVLVASADDTDSGVRRRVTQAFSVTESGDEASRAARKRLFQNAVWWLLNCSSCANLNLVPFVSIDPAPAPETDHFAVTIRVHATGACEALGVRTVCELSPNLRFVRATATRGFWEADAAIGMVTFFLGRIPSASDEIIEMILRPVRSGDVSVDVRLESLNEAVGALEDNRTEISARADGPPGLVLRREVSGPFELTLKGRTGRTYRIESAPSVSGPWTELRTVVVESDDGTERVTIEAGTAPLFFRVQVP